MQILSSRPLQSLLLACCAIVGYSYKNAIANLFIQKVYKPLEAKWNPRKAVFVYSEINKSINQNGWEMMNAFLKKDKKENFSFSVLDCLSHLAKISKGITNNEKKQEMQQALHMGSVEWENEIANWEKSFTSDSNTQTSCPEITHHAAALVREDLVLANKQEKVISFKTAEDAVNKGNEWVNKATNGQIPDLIKNLDPNTAVTLLTASVFDSKWQYPFNANSTKLNPFTNHDGKEIQVPRMVVASDNHRFAYLDKMTVLELPFEDNHFSCLIFLPDSKTSYSKGNQRLDPVETLTTFFEENNAEKVMGDLNQKLRAEKSMKIGIPKVNLAYQTNLCETLTTYEPIKLLKDLDVSHLIENPNPQNPLKFADMCLSTKVELTEKNMKFVAAQYTQSYNQSCPPPPFNVDHPFAWMIVQNQGTLEQDVTKYNYITQKNEKVKEKAPNLSTILFAGVVTELEDQAKK